MAEIIKEPGEIARLIQNIVGDANSFIRSLEKTIAGVTERLETATATLNSVTDFNGKAKGSYDLAKKALTSLETDLKGFTSSYAELFNLVGINYTEETFAKLTEDVKKYVDSQKDLMDSYKVQMNSLDGEIASLTEELKTLQGKLHEQEATKEKLSAYMKAAETGDLSLSKKELMAFLGSVVDENGVPVFKGIEISIAAQIIAFSENFSTNLDQSGKTVGSVLKDAMAQPDLENIEPEAANEEDLYNLDLMMPEDFIPTASLEEPEPLTMPANLEVSDINASTSLKADERMEMDPYALINELQKEEPVKQYDNVIPFPDSKNVNYTEEEMARFNENIGYLKSIGIPTSDIKRYPVTLYNITIKNIEEGLTMAKKAGITVRGIGDIVALCSRENVNDLLNLAIEIYGSEYAEVAKKTPLCKILETARQHLKEVKVTNANLEKRIPELAELQNIKEEVSGSAAAWIALGMEGKLNEAAKSTPFAYIINGVHIPRQRLEKNLARMSNLEISNRELLLAAITYGSTLTEEEMAMLAGQIEDIVAEEEPAMRMAA